jgi:hypothetical protein
MTQIIDKATGPRIPMGRQLTRLLRTRRERPGSRTNNSFNEIASSHCRPQGSGPVRTMLWNAAITAGFATGEMGSALHFA